ncbi:MAG: hypothetical protein HUU35_20390, partial [Armatimonadetes bacterium]|nr:hypothetical protein [Armatimonadota bacterium]
GGAVVLGLLLVNGPNTMPSPLWPRWAGEWPAAEAAIQRLQLPCTVVTPGQSALRVAARGQPAMTIVDLSYAAPTLGGQDFLDWLAYTVERAMGQGAVYLEAAEPPFRPRQLGAWEMVEGGHHLRREKVVKLLATRYQLSPVPGVDPWLQRLDAR